MRSLIRAYPTETRLFAVLVAICAFLSFASPNFLSSRQHFVASEQQRRERDLGGRPAGRSDLRRDRHLFRGRGLGRPIFERIRVFRHWRRQLVDRDCRRRRDRNRDRLRQRRAHSLFSYCFDRRHHRHIQRLLRPSHVRHLRPQHLRPARLVDGSDRCFSICWRWRIDSPRRGDGRRDR